VEALQGLEGEAGDLLLGALSDEDRSVRLAAARRLASQPGDRAAIWDALRESDRELRGEVMGAMEQTNPGVLSELALDRLGSQDQDERALAVEIVGWGTTQACVEAAIHALQDLSAPVRRMATKSLARLRDAAAAGVLGRALGDPDSEVRIGVVRALGVIDDESVLGFLVSALNDPDPGVREVASEVLTQWSSPAVAKRLAGVLAVPGLRDAVSDVLARIGPSSVELLVDVLHQGNPAIVQTVGGLLQRIVGLEEMIQRMSSVEPERRLRAAEAVGAIGGPSAADALMRSLSDPDERIRTRCAQLLARIGDRRAASAIEATVLRDPVPEVVAAAQEALAMLGGQAA
jgi:HEAT repeat protein